MSWWQWVLVVWFGFSLLLVLIMATADWWYKGSLDREWKKLNDRTPQP